MKKLVFKKWVDYLMVVIQFILFLILAGEVDNMKVFVISKLIAMIIFIFNHMLMVKYSRLIGD